MEAAPVEATVTELYRISRELLADERARGQTLDSKTSTLAGFAGTILALNAAFANDVFKIDLGAVGSTAIRVIYVITAAALAAGATLAVAGVLRPQQRLAIAREDLESFGQFPLIAEPKMHVEGRMLNTTVTALVHERALNDRKARLTRLAAAALVVGFSGVGLLAVLAGVAAG